MLFQHILATWYQQCQPCGQFLAQENRLKLSLSEKQTKKNIPPDPLHPMDSVQCTFLLKKYMVTYTVYIYITV